MADGLSQLFAQKLDEAEISSHCYSYRLAFIMKELKHNNLGLFFLKAGAFILINCAEYQACIRGRPFFLVSLLLV